MGVDPRLGNMTQYFLGQITVGVDESNSMPKCDVLENHVAEEGRFAGSSFSDDVNMVSVVGWRQSKILTDVPADTLTKNYLGFFIR